MTTMTSNTTRNHREENAELWDLLRRSQSRLANIKTKTPEYYDTDTTSDDSFSDEGRDDSIVANDEYEEESSTDDDNNGNEENDEDDEAIEEKIGEGGNSSGNNETKEENTGESTEKSGKNNVNQDDDNSDHRITEEDMKEKTKESRNNEEKLKVRDYEREHREVLHLLEQSKQRLSKTAPIVVLEEEEDSVLSSDEESSSFDGSNCWDEEDDLSLSSNEEEVAAGSSTFRQPMFDMNEEEKDKTTTNLEETPVTVMESVADNFDDFFDEDFEIAYTGSNDNSENRAEECVSKTGDLNLKNVTNLESTTDSNNQIMTATEPHQQIEDSNDWDWDEDDIDDDDQQTSPLTSIWNKVKDVTNLKTTTDSKDQITTATAPDQEADDSNDWDWDEDNIDDDQTITPLKSIWNKAQNAISEVTSPEPEEEDNFFDFFDKKFDSNFGSKGPRVATRTSTQLKPKQVAKPTSMTTAINQVLVESEATEEEDVAGPLSMLWSATRNVVKTAVKTVAEEFNELDKTMESNASDMSNILQEGEEELDFTDNAEITSNNIEERSSTNLTETETPLFPKTEEINTVATLGQRQDHSHGDTHAKENIITPVEPSAPSRQQIDKYEESEATVEEDLKSLSTFLWSSIPKSWSQLQEMGDEAAEILS